MPKVTLQDGISFPADDDETILDAAERAGVNIGYACRTGRCSTCKCKVVSGTTRALHPEIGLSEQDAEDGWTLSCVRTAQTDISAIADELVPFDLPAKQILPCRIDSLVKLAPDVLEIRLRLPPSATFRYIPGQYIDVIGPGGVRRSYSLASGGAAHRLTLHVREVPGGQLSNYWFTQAQPNDLLRLYGPLGTFFLRDFEERHIIFLATGTGIAPVTAMLEALALADAPAPKEITVIWGGRHTADLYIDVDGMSGKHAYWPVLSRADTAWGGRRGYVQSALLAAGIPLENATVYACGSDDMVRSARDALVAAGLDSHQFHADAFVCSAKF